MTVRTSSGFAGRTRRYLYTLVAINLIIMGLIAASFGYHQWVQDRVFERVVRYHTVTSRAVQSGLAELHDVSDALWRRTLLHEVPEAFSSLGHAGATEHATIAAHISVLAEEREIVLALQQQFADAQFEEATELAISAFEPVLLIGSPGDPTRGDLAARLVL
ncbi:MAG: hypothetical protein KAJ11_15575, partial [Alphaproteobacteria bacterium]|nr:hypothetical protein [Alphaproteobacteria bacterium]